MWVGLRKRSMWSEEVYQNFIKKCFLSFSPHKPLTVLGEKKEKQGETWKWWHGNGVDVTILFDFSFP